MFGVDEGVEVLGLEDELVVEIRVNLREFVHRGEFGACDAWDFELDEGEACFGVERESFGSFLVRNPFGEGFALPVLGFGCADEIAERGGDVDGADGVGDDVGCLMGNVHDHRDVVCLAGTVEGEAVTEGDVWLVEVVAVIGVDDDDGAVGEVLFFEGRENFLHAVVEFAGAAVVEGANLGDVLGGKRVPF